jgi:phosphatidylserine/phosphatidylglycerophosphate/cardiolipin synthase-like enzyme
MRSVALVLATVIGCGPTAGTDPDAAVGDGGGHHDAATDGGGTLSSDVTVIVEPNGNNSSELIAAINGAHQSVYMTMYMLGSSAVINALIGRKQAGVDVQVVLDSSSATSSYNTSAYSQLHSAGVAVVMSSTTFSYTHEKCVIIDGTSAWIMTMNANATSAIYNREYLAIDTDPADVAEATAVFKADHALQPITPTGNLVVANANARPKLVQLIDSATKTLDVEGEEFSDTYSTGVVNAVARAAHRGVVVHVVIANSGPPLPPITLVKNSGGHVVITGPTSINATTTNPYIHAKAIVVDCVAGTCARGYVGSENFSGGSLGYNRELGVIFGNAAELAKIKTTIDADFSRGVAQ